MMCSKYEMITIHQYVYDMFYDTMIYIFFVYNDKQVHIFGELLYAQGFENHNIFLKWKLESSMEKYWRQLDGEASGRTWLAEVKQVTHTHTHRKRTQLQTTRTGNIHTITFKQN